MSSTEAQTQVKPEGGEPISLIVKSQDGQETMFKVKKSTTMQKIMDAYANKMGLDVNSLVLIFDGHRCQGRDTPGSLEMEDGDCLDAMLHQLGGGGSH